MIVALFELLLYWAFGSTITWALMNLGLQAEATKYSELTFRSRVLFRIMVVVFPAGLLTLLWNKLCN